MLNIRMLFKWGEYESIPNARSILLFADADIFQNGMHTRYLQ